MCYISPDMSLIHSFFSFIHSFGYSFTYSIYIDIDGYQLHTLTLFYLWRTLLRNTGAFCDTTLYKNTLRIRKYLIETHHLINMTHLLT